MITLCKISATFMMMGLVNTHNDVVHDSMDGTMSDNPDDTMNYPMSYQLQDHLPGFPEDPMPDYRGEPIPEDVEDQFGYQEDISNQEQPMANQDPIPSPLGLYFTFSEPKVQSSRLFYTSIDGFSIPLRLVPGNSYLPEQHTVLNKWQVAFIQRPVDLPVTGGSYNLSFDWYLDSMGSQFQVLFNGEVVNTLNSNDLKAHKQTVKVTACSYCKGKNKFRIETIQSGNLHIANISLIPLK